MWEIIKSFYTNLKAVEHDCPAAFLLLHALIEPVSM